VDIILNDKNEPIEIDENPRPNILIIDEVDVFFNDSFYGQVYKPTARIKDPTINALIRYLWSKKNEKQYLRDL
jgi:hypothetical protein